MKRTRESCHPIACPCVSETREDSVEPAVARRAGEPWEVEIMRRESSRAAIVSLVFLVFVQIVCGQLLAEGLFEDESPAQAAPAVASPTAEGKVLATEIIRKVNESYYKMFQVVGGFEATYTVQRGEEVVGKATVSADLPAGSPRWSVTFEGKVSDGEKALIENRLCVAWTPMLLDPSGQVITAQVSAEGFRLPYSSSFKESYLVVSKDYRVLKDFTKGEDGSETEWLYQDQEVGGKRYLDTLELRTGSARTKVTYTYARREGVSLISRLEIQEMTAWGDTTRRYSAKLEGVTFKKAAATAEAARPTPEATAEVAAAGDEPVIDASTWDELSREVLPKVLEMSLDNATMLRFVRSASCTIDVVITTKMVASTTNPYFTPPTIPPSAVSFSYSYEDSDNDGVLTQDEITVETTHLSDANMRFAAGRISKGLRELATFNIVNVLPEVTVKTRKLPQGYELILTPRDDKDARKRKRRGETDLNPIRLTVSNDFRVTAMRTESAEGLDQITTLNHVRTGGKWLLTEVETKSAGATAFAAGDKSALAYRMEGGLPLVTKMISDSSTPSSVGTLQIHQEYTFSKWKIVRREKPLEVAAVRVAATAVTGEETEPAGAEVKVPRTAEARKLAYDFFGRINKSYNSLLSTDVVAFDASYAIERGGKPVGNMRLTWNRRQGKPSATVEEAATDQVRKKAQGFGDNVFAAVAGSGLLPVGGEGSFYAVKTGGEYTIDMTQEACKEDPNLKAMIVFVPEDLNRIRTLMFAKDAFVVETVQQAEDVDGVKFLSTKTVTATAGNKVLETQEITYTYGRREGTLFVTKLQEKDTVVNTVETWTFALKNVIFQRGALPVEQEREEAGQELEEAEKELQETIQRLLQENKDKWLGRDRTNPE